MRHDITVEMKLGRSSSLSTLANEERKLQERSDLRNKRKMQKRRSRNSNPNITFPVSQKKDSLESQVSDIVISSKADATVLVQYKNKLALYVVDEIGAAYRSIENSGSCNESEIGLSIDEEDDLNTEQKTQSQSQLTSHEASSVVKSLFYQVSSKIPDHISTQLRFKEEVFFYELLSSHFGSSGMENFVEQSLMPKCRRLFSLETFPALFAMLFYRYAAKAPTATQPSVSAVFVKGLGQILSHDVNQQTRRLFSMFSFVRSNLSTPNFQNNDELKIQLAKFYFYYCSSDLIEVKSFLAESNLGINEFINIILKFLSGTKLEPKVVVHYMHCLAKLKQLQSQFNQDTIQKLHSVLNTFFINNSELHKSAKVCLDELFPASRLSRRLITSVFRMYGDAFALAFSMVTTFTPVRLGYWRN